MRGSERFRGNAPGTLRPASYAANVTWFGGKRRVRWCLRYAAERRILVRPP